MVKEAESGFIWDPHKEADNIKKHGVGFLAAAKVFKDPKRKIYIDRKHSQKEERFFCIGMVEGKVITVRFSVRDDKIRIIGAGHRRKGARYYEQEKRQ